MSRISWSVLFKVRKLDQTLMFVMLNKSLLKRISLSVYHVFVYLTHIKNKLEYFSTVKQFHSNSDVCSEVPVPPYKLWARQEPTFQDFTPSVGY
jgi:hypothetical protein